MVRLQHHKTPLEISEGILCFDNTCLKSDNFNRFINTA